MENCHIWTGNGIDLSTNIDNIRLFLYALDFLSRIFENEFLFTLISHFRSYKHKTGKMRPLAESVRPLFPFFTFFVIFMLWVHNSPSNIAETDPRVLYLLSGTIFSNISVSWNSLNYFDMILVSISFQCRLIVSQMSNTRCESVHWMTPLFVFSILIGLMAPFLERLILYSLCILATLSHWHYGTIVVQQMCVYFGRICFGVTTVKPQHGEREEEETNNNVKRD